jgi:hypothetical protein
MKNFTVTMIEFFVVFGLSLASATMLAGLYISALYPKLQPVADMNTHVTMQYRRLE